MTLADSFQQPANWQWATVSAPERPDQTIRYGFAIPDNPEGIVFIGQGLTEYVEKYFEVTKNLLARNFAVVAWDWRRQGGSWRHLQDHAKRHHDDIAHDVTDMKTVIDTASAHPVLQPLKRIFLGHSMGGHIGLRFLYTHPEIFDKAVLSAPLCDTNFAASTRLFAMALVKGAYALGQTERYAIGCGPWREETVEKDFDEKTLSEDHRNMQRHWLRKNPHLKMGGYTYGFLSAILQSTAATTNNAEWLRKIETPVLFAIGTAETIVSKEAIGTAAGFMPNASIHVIENALHELLVEREDIQKSFWAAFDDFTRSGPATHPRLTP